MPGSSRSCRRASSRSGRGRDTRPSRPTRRTCRASCAAWASRRRRPVPRLAHRRRPGPRLGARAAVGAAERDVCVVGAGRFAASAHAGEPRRDGLQGLQHRHPRDGPQRRAGVLAVRGSTTTLLQGVPGTAFTEALAFTFQHRDLELLGVAKPDPREEHTPRDQGVLGIVGDRRQRAWVDLDGLALDVRAPRRHAGAAARSDGGDSRAGIGGKYYAPVLGSQGIRSSRSIRT